MAPVIWGLPLGEMKWSKFKSSYMWNNAYHRRKTKFIIYQAAMISTVVSESLGTAALSGYLDQQTYIEQVSKKTASEFNNDIVGVGSYNIFVGVYVATIFGAAFFFDLFWPERHESKSVKLAWKICAILACFFTTSAAIALTVVVSRHSAHVYNAGGSNHSQADLDKFVKDSGGPPTVYRNNPKTIASVVFLWIGVVSTVASAILLWKTQDHITTFGPKSTHEREKAPTGAMEDVEAVSDKSEPRTSA
ncbi:hypothetical protein F4780DRAFT_182670 [Xylariomycetidae sp. FL0641]|nr:hypothetical protein F4780DRAFT_182670 [Xylariomycetidae sp. FL0641]